MSVASREACHGAFLPRCWVGRASWGLLGGPREVDITSCMVILAWKGDRAVATASGPWRWGLARPLSLCTQALAVSGPRELPALTYLFGILAVLVTAEPVLPWPWAAGDWETSYPPGASPLCSRSFPLGAFSILSSPPRPHRMPKFRVRWYFQDLLRGGLFSGSQPQSLSVLGKSLLHGSSRGPRFSSPGLCRRCTGESPHGAGGRMVALRKMLGRTRPLVPQLLSHKECHHLLFFCLEPCGFASCVCGVGVPLTPSDLLPRDPQRLPGQPASLVAKRLQTFLSY